MSLLLALFSSDATVTVTGITVATTVGNVTVTADANCTTTGMSCATSIGAVTVSAGATVGTVTGMSAATTVGTVTVQANGTTTTITGITVTMTVGTVITTADARAPPSGMSAAGTMGAVVITADANDVVTGMSVVTTMGAVTVSEDANNIATGLTVTAVIGTVTISATSNPNVVVSGLTMIISLTMTMQNGPLPQDAQRQGGAPDLSSGASITPIVIPSAGAYGFASPVKTNKKSVRKLTFRKNDDDEKTINEVAVKSVTIKLTEITVTVDREQKLVMRIKLLT